MNRVAITGVGVITPIGCEREEFWNSLVCGKSGIGPVTRFDTAHFDAKIAAEVRGFDPEQYGIGRKELRSMDLFTQYALAAASGAIGDSRLPLDGANPDVGVMVGTGIGGLWSIEGELRKGLEKGLHRAGPHYIPTIMPNAASGAISMRYHLNGTSITIGSACATGLHSIIYAAKDIMQGDSVAMVAGGTESCMTPTAYASFMNMKALTKSHNDQPDKASRPFDALRDGFVMGEGAGVLVLESLEHALRHDAHIYAEIIGYGSTSDAYHITEPDPGSLQQARAMALALHRAGIPPEEVDYINAHGTSTKLNDASETRALKMVFGSHAYNLLISANKSVMGHLIGAAGAVETIATALCLERGLLPPTINHEHPDPDCDLNYVPNVARARTIEVAMKNSFGFGGHNAVLLLKRYHP